MNYTARFAVVYLGMFDHVQLLHKIESKHPDTQKDIFGTRKVGKGWELLLKHITKTPVMKRNET